MVNNAEQRNYSVAAAEDAQANFNAVASRLESLIELRDQQVKAAQADYFADGVSDQYVALEARWTAAADEVRNIITSLRTVLERNNESATAAIGKAKNAVSNIGA